MTEKQMAPAPPALPDQESVLRAIEAHLKSIRSMLTFFTIITIFSLILGGCTVLGII